MNAPLYSKRTSLHPATQLHWNYTVTWQSAPIPPIWLGELQRHCVVDGILVRDYELLDAGRGVLLLDSRANVSPHTIVQRLRGRLQAVLRRWDAKALAAEDELSSIGTFSQQAVEALLRQQRFYSPPSAPTPEPSRFVEYRWDDPTVDLNRASEFQNKRYWYNLHVVFTFAEIVCLLNDNELGLVWQTLMRVAQQKQHWLRRAEIQTDSLQACLRGQWMESPEEIALTYLNEFAFSVGQRKVFGDNYLVGTESPGVQ